MTVLITGATGLIGKAIVEQCHSRGMVVHYLTTSKSKLITNDNYKGFYWNPKTSEIDHQCFKDVSVIINLVGASIAKRWTVAYKKEIRNSRVVTAKLLLETIKTHNYDIKQIISASAIGIYPTSYTNYYEEDYKDVSPSFLGDVVEVWENTIDQFKDLDIKIAKVRIGLVLAKKDGALPEIIKPIKLGMGAALGSGKQWQSWIHIKDIAAIFSHILEQQLEGIYNGVAPNAVTNKELTTVAAHILNKPMLLPNVPKFTMRLLLGEMHILLFESQRVSSQKIESEAFQFQFSNIKLALEDLLQ